MAATTYLSKQWTVLIAVGFLRVLADKLSDDELTDEALIDILYGAVCSVVELLGPAAYKDYGQLVAITSANDLTSDTYDISALEFDSLIKISDTDNNLYKEVRMKELDNFHALNNQFASKIVFAQHGEVIYFNKGSNTYATTVNLYYIRMPQKAGIDSGTVETGDTLDIRDKYADLVIDKAKIKVYELLGKVAPESLTQSVNASSAQVRAANLAEMNAVQQAKAQK